MNDLAIVTLYFREEGNQSGSRRVDMFLPSVTSDEYSPRNMKRESSASLLRY